MYCIQMEDWALASLQFVHTPCGPSDAKHCVRLRFVERQIFRLYLNLLFKVVILLIDFSVQNNCPPDSIDVVFVGRI